MGYQPARPHSISAAQFVRQFAECRILARNHPVMVTSYGRTTHALIAIEEFENLLAAGESAAGDARADAAGELLRGLGQWLDCGLIVCDADLRVEWLNARASALCQVGEGDAAGRDLAAALPLAEGSLLAALAARTAHTGDAGAADIPSPFTDGAWVRIRSLPWAGRTLLLIRDITCEVRSERLADREASIMEAMKLHGGIAHLRLSLRGTIEAAGDGFCALVSLPRRRLLGVQLADLVDVGQRPDMRAAVEAVLRNEAGRKLATRFISNDGGMIQARVALVRLHGSYGVEGAIALISPAESPPAG